MEMNKTYNLRNRLVSLTLLPLVAIVFLMCFGYFTFNHLTQNLDHAVNVDIPQTRASGNMRVALDTIYQNILMLAQEDIDAMTSEEVGRIAESAKRYSQEAFNYQKSIRSKDETEKYKSVEENWNNVNELAQMIVEAGNKTQWTNKDAKQAFQNRLKAAVMPVSGALSAAILALNDLDEVRQRNTKQWVQEAEQTSARNSLYVSGGAIAICLILLLFGLWTVQSTHRALSDVTGYISKSGASLRNVSDEVQTCGTKLLSETEESLRQVQGTISYIHDIKGTVETNNQLSLKAAELSGVAMNAAEYGDMKTTDLLSIMEILSESSSQIQAISDVIDDISFQINLLSLNASVEAARAGEQGRGFAVVADAVRNLAGKSGEASQSISRLINDAVGNIKMSYEITQGNQASLKEILSSISELSHAIEKIKTASSEQVVQVEGIDQAMKKIDSVANANAETAHELSESAASQIEQSKILEEAANLLNSMVNKAERKSA